MSEGTGEQTDMMNGPKFPRGDVHTNWLAEGGKWCVVSPLLVTAIQRIPFTHCTDPLYLIITYHNNGTVALYMSACGWVNVHIVYICASAPCILYCLLIHMWMWFQNQCKLTQCRSVEYVNILFWRTCVYLYISECEFGCVRVQAPQRDQWVGTWPCQYSWSLSV